MDRKLLEDLPDREGVDRELWCSAFPRRRREFPGTVEFKVPGVWIHQTETPLAAIRCKGEVCATSSRSPLFHESRWMSGVVMVGTARAHFSNDCFSIIGKSGRREMGAFMGPTDHDEAWVTPADSRVLSVFLGESLRGKEREKLTAYPIFEDLEDWIDSWSHQGSVEEAEEKADIRYTNRCGRSWNQRFGWRPFAGLKLR